MTTSVIWSPAGSGIEVTSMVCVSCRTDSGRECRYETACEVASSVENVVGTGEDDNDDMDVEMTEVEADLLGGT